MNKVWAERKLVAYLALCEQIRRAIPESGYWNEEADKLNQEAQLMLATVEKIMRAVDASDVAALMPPSYTSHDGEGRVRRCLGALRESEEVEANLRPDAPELIADQLHPTIWSAASLIWNTEQYRAAVAQAALVLSAQIKSRARSKLSDRKLVQDVFAPELPKGEGVRLHFSGDRDDETWKSQQHGLHLLAQGAFAGIRNVTAHEDDELSEHEALEYLAVLSVVARWFDATETTTT